MSQKPQQNGTSDVIKVRYEKLDALKEAGRDPFVITTSARDVLTETIKNNFEEYENKDVCVAGRLLSKRGKGKVSFMDLWDRSGKIQIFAKFDDLGEEEYGFLKKWDIGDIVEVKGFVFKTQMGEISVHAKEVKLLSKSLKPLPEKYHGLTNTDLRYRQRYVDLIMNPEVKDTFVKRSKIISSIRRYLDNQGFMEVETPMLVANAGGASARPFLTHFNALDEDLKLRISLELYLKRLIVGGLEKVYEIGRVFRNEGVDTRHNPEFTLMELYQAYTDYNGMMDLTENLYRHVAQEVLGTTTITYNGIEMDLGKPFERITMLDAVKKYSGVDFNEIHSDEEAKAIAKEKSHWLYTCNWLARICRSFTNWCYCRLYSRRLCWILHNRLCCRIVLNTCCDDCDTYILTHHIIIYSTKYDIRAVTSDFCQICDCIVCFHNTNIS